MPGSLFIALARTARAVCDRRLPGSSTRAILAFALFAAVQLSDGVLTHVGVGQFGITAEANPVIGMTMKMFGVTAALTGWKLFAVFAGAVLHCTECYLTLAILTLMSVVAATIPWAWILAL